MRHFTKFHISKTLLEAATNSKQNNVTCLNSQFYLYAVTVTSFLFMPILGYRLVLGCVVKGRPACFMCSRQPVLCCTIVTAQYSHLHTQTQSVIVGGVSSDGVCARARVCILGCRSPEQNPLSIYHFA